MSVSIKHLNFEELFSQFIQPEIQYLSEYFDRDDVPEFIIINISCDEDAVMIKYTGTGNNISHPGAIEYGDISVVDIGTQTKRSICVGFDMSNKEEEVIVAVLKYKEEYLWTEDN